MGELDRWVDERAKQREHRVRQLGTRKPRCRRCGESDPFVLVGVQPEIDCYECLAIEQGRSPIEGHHVSGRANDPEDVVSIPANDHRALSAGQARWSRETLRNPDGSPLLRAAAAIRGWLEILALIVDRTVGWVPEFLEWLDGELRERVGPRWWRDLGWEG